MPGDQDENGWLVEHGFLWSRGVMTDLGTVAGFSCSRAYFISSAGQVVGESFPCDFSEPGNAFLWENGGPAIDLNAFVPSGSDLVLVEAVSVDDRGEIVTLGVLPNGDTRAVLLVPRGLDEDAAEDATDASQDDGPPMVQRSANVTHAGLAPDMLSTLRARFANRHGAFRPRPLTKAN